MESGTGADMGSGHGATELGIADPASEVLDPVGAADPAGDFDDKVGRYKSGAELSEIP